MIEVNIREAKKHLSRLVQRVLDGEEVVVARAGRPLVRLVPIEAPSREVVLGLDEGKAWIAEDFDAPLPDEVLRGFEG